MNTPISGIIPELLAKKGYNEPCKYCVDNEFDKPMPYNGGMGMHQNSFGMYYSCPTIAQVIMWLYEKHEVWIQIQRETIGSDEWVFAFVIDYLPKEFFLNKRRASHFKTIESFIPGMSSYEGGWKEPNEAYLQAIEYTLKNLI